MTVRAPPGWFAGGRLPASLLKLIAAVIPVAETEAEPETEWQNGHGLYACRVAGRWTGLPEQVLSTDRRMVPVMNVRSRIVGVGAERDRSDFSACRSVSPSPAFFVPIEILRADDRVIALMNVRPGVVGVAAKRNCVNRLARCRVYPSRIGGCRMQIDCDGRQRQTTQRQ